MIRHASYADSRAQACLLEALHQLVAHCQELLLFDFLHLHLVLQACTCVCLIRSGLISMRLPLCYCMVQDPRANMK